MSDWLPTRAFVRGAVVATGLIILALVTGRVEALVLGIPFLVYVVVAALGRRPQPRLRAHVDRGGITADVDDPPARTITAITWPESDEVVPAGPRAVLEASGEEHRVALECTAYGTHRLDPVRIAMTDALGAWQRASTLPLGPIVYLPTLRAPADGEFARPRPGSTLATSRLEGGDGAIARIRDYADGDDPRRLNWRVFARTGELATTVYTTEVDRPTLIVTDTRWNLPTDPTALDQTIQAAWWAAASCVKRGDAVGVHDLGGRLRPIPIGRHGVLERLRLGIKDMPRDFVSSRDAGTPPTVGPGSSVVICSPLLRDDVPALVGALLRRGVRVTVIDTGARDEVARDEAVALRARRAMRDGAASGLAERVPVLTWDPRLGRPERRTP